MVSRIARLAALALPVLLVGIVVSAGGWRIHDGRVERVTQTATSAAAPVAPSVGTAPTPTDEMTFIHHLSPSVPWPAWAGLIVLCLLPAVASMVAWSGARRGRDVAFSASGGAA